MNSQFQVKFKSGEVSALDPVGDTFELNNDTYTLSGIISGTWFVTPIIRANVSIGISVIHKDYEDDDSELLIYDKLKSETGFIGFMDKTYFTKLKAGFNNTVSKHIFDSTIINATEDYPNCSVVYGRVALVDVVSELDDTFSLYATHTDDGRVVKMSIILNRK